MNRTTPPTLDELLALYAEGPEVICGLVQDLFAHLSTLQQKVDELTARLNKDSHNSNKPPSSDVFKKPRKPPNLRVKSGKRSGGQKGHAGCTLEAVSKPDHHVLHAPSTCGLCGHSLANAEIVGSESHQVFDLPKLALEVTEHEVVSCVCSHCRALNRGKFPESAMQPTQYGPRFLGVLTYLNQYQLIPLARTQECVADLFGHEPSQATIVLAIEKCAQQLAPVEKATKAAIAKSDVVHFDETGMRVVKRLHWVHTASTRCLTFYCHHDKRGQAAVDYIGILKRLRGTAVHDCFSVYLNWGLRCQHQLCGVHLLREMLGIFEDTKQTWPQRMSALLRSLQHAKQSAQAAGQNKLDTELLERYNRAYERIIVRGLIKNPAPKRTGGRTRPAASKACNVLLRLWQRRHAVLRFAIDFKVPFDNNLAERDLRMVKLRQKISGCFRSADGANNFCTIRGYISTLRKQNIGVMKALEAAFVGNPTWPSLESA